MNSGKIVVTLISLGMIAVIFFGVRYYIAFQKYKKIIREVSINKVNISQVSDGTYPGSFDAAIVAANVSVSVKDHKITDIQLIRHKHERGQKAEVIPQRVLSAQSLDVDVVSGATNSSKVILKAIENALNKGMQ